MWIPRGGYKNEQCRKARGKLNTASGVLSVYRPPSGFIEKPFAIIGFSQRSSNELLPFRVINRVKFPLFYLAGESDLYVDQKSRHFTMF